MPLPQHIADVLQVDAAAEQSDVKTSLSILAEQRGVLFTDTGKEYFLEQLESPAALTCEICEPLGEYATWQFKSASLDSAECAEIVEVPTNLSAASPPTNAENSLIRAWFTTPEITNSLGSCRSNIAVFTWRATASDPVKELVRAMCGVRLATGQPISIPRVWANAATINVRTSSRALSNPGAALIRKLYLQTCTEATPQWRFLSLYRILEHGYLESVFFELSANFFASPGQAIATAKSELASEVEQFCRLVQMSGLQAEFEQIASANDVIAGGGNRFAVLIKQEADRRGYSDLFKRGVAVAYQIRCAIVHAGSLAIIFDRTPGADEVVDAHMPMMERAVLKLLSIDVS